MNINGDRRLRLTFLLQGSKSQAILYGSSDADSPIASPSPTVSVMILEKRASQQDVLVFIQSNNGLIDRILTVTISGGRHAEIQLD